MFGPPVRMSSEGPLFPVDAEFCQEYLSGPATWARSLYIVGMEDDLLFVEDGESAGPAKLLPWKVLVADDDPSVHTITELVLRSYRFLDRPILCLHAYDSPECIQILETHADIGVILLDVVMEKDHSGLELVKTIREKMGNSAVRIILRTGQPGRAPEEEVVSKYDINDYRLKTELTAQKLQSTLTSALRSYQAISQLEQANALLLGMLMGWEGPRSSSSLEEYMTATARLLKDFLAHPLLEGRVALFRQMPMNDPELLEFQGEGLRKGFLAAEYPDLESASEAMARELGLGRGASFRALDGADYLLCAFVHALPSSIAEELLRIFELQFTLNLDTFQVRQGRPGNGLSSLFGDFIQTVSQEDEGHAQRLGIISQALARAMGMSELSAEQLRLAAQLHDIGNALLPRGLISKKGALSPQERQQMQTHTKAGFDLLKHSDREIFRLASKVALEHHERWNGSGYPGKLKGEEICIEARIVAIADVFDALTREEIYRPARSEEEALEEMRKEGGQGLDPGLVELFLKHYPDIKEVLELYR